MSFIHGKFGEDEEILCPCSRCLNQKYQHQALVERHILMNGMESTYTRWIHHLENFNVHVVEHLIDVHDLADGLIHGLSVTEDDNYGCLNGLGVTEDDNYGADHLNGSLQDGENQDGNSDAILKGQSVSIIQVVPIFQGCPLW